MCLTDYILTKYIFRVKKMKVKFTELNTGYKGERRVSRLSQKGKAKAVITVTLVVLFVFTFILSSVGIIPIDALFLRARVSVSGSSERFPIAVNTESTLVTDVSGDNIIILTTENVMVYSPNGKQLLNQPHTYAKPGISVNGKNIAVFDRGGKSFMLIKEDETVFEGTAENIIISAEYGSNGNYALGTHGSGVTSTLSVYDKSNKEIFRWNCAHEHIVSIALSDNGRYAGVAVMGAENGQIFTTVQYFGFDYKEPLNTQKITGVTPLNIKFTKFNLLTLLTDRGVYSVERKEEKYQTVFTYYSSEFNSCDFSESGKYIVTLAKYGSENVFEINLFSKSGEIQQTVSADFEIKATQISDKYIFALGESKIIVYNLRGVKVSEITYKGEAFSILPTDDFVFISSLDKITRCFSYGDSSVELSA